MVEMYPSKISQRVLANSQESSEFTSKSFANQIFKKIEDKQKYGFLHYNPHYDLQEDHGTTHLTVIDWMVPPSH
ncbi:hypothetical protein BY996DRAFT_6567190 [Phakopsora pachyrhizi]|nr:hypothetical protein BY996DRAFT_6567190 [Phakopsora pachyrhizi]